MEGYTMDGFANGQKEFAISCLATRMCAEGDSDPDCRGVYERPSSFQPVLCGPCLTLDNKTFAEAGDRYFPEKCSYTCDQGYTMDADAAGPSTFETKCTPAGTFSDAAICRRVNCGNPPGVQHAEVVNDGNKVYEDIGHYKALKGYTKSGFVGGEDTGTRQCLHTGLFSTAPIFLPVSCGIPPPVEHADYDASVLVYKQKVVYTCQTGYSLNHKADGPITAEKKCQFDGEYSNNEVICHPVQCGAPPTVAKSSTESTVNMVVYPQTVPYTCNAGYSLVANDDPMNRASINWAASCNADGTFSTEECVDIDDCLVRTCGHLGDFFKCYNILPPTADPMENFECKCAEGYEEIVYPDRKTCQNINDCPVDNICGGEGTHGSLRGTCQDLLIGYTCNCAEGYEMTHMSNPKTNVTCTPVSCGDLLDKPHSDVKSPKPSELHFETNPWTYRCQDGYSLNAVYGGEREMVVSCQSSGQTSELPECLAVSCGAFVSRANADASPQQDELFYPDKLTYTCEEGFSTNAKADGSKTFEVQCNTNGTQSGFKQCPPVECGTFPRQDHDQNPNDQTVYTYTQSIMVQCATGYSTDRTAPQSAPPNSATYVRTCQSNGHFTDQEDCKAVQCPVAPDVNHTTHDSDAAKIRFYPQKFKYKLDKGYTLDGNHDGTKDFEIDCKADATWTRTQIALPVQCGEAPSRAHATNPGGSRVFPNTEEYTCVIGHSINGKADGKKKHSS
jgi:hypothetical protein